MTWNPRVYAWRDLRRDIARLRRSGALETDWSVARSRQARAGDRVFLLRQGVEPRGIVGSGWLTSDWDVARELERIWRAVARLRK